MADLYTAVLESILPGSWSKMSTRWPNGVPCRPRGDNGPSGSAPWSDLPLAPNAVIQEEERPCGGLNHQKPHSSTETAGGDFLALLVCRLPPKAPVAAADLPDSAIIRNCRYRPSPQRLLDLFPSSFVGHGRAKCARSPPMTISRQSKIQLWGCKRNLLSSRTPLRAALTAEVLCRARRLENDRVISCPEIDVVALVIHNGLMKDRDIVFPLSRFSTRSSKRRAVRPLPVKFAGR